MGVLTPGKFEEFFRILGDLYEHSIFHSEPVPYRFDRVIQRIAELDLKLLGYLPRNNNGIKGEAKIIHITEFF